MDYDGVALVRVWQDNISQVVEHILYLIKNIEGLRSCKFFTVFFFLSTVKFIEKTLDAF